MPHPVMIARPKTNDRVLVAPAGTPVASGSDHASRADSDHRDHHRDRGDRAHHPGPVRPATVGRGAGSWGVSCELGDADVVKAPRPEHVAHDAPSGARVRRPRCGCPFLVLFCREQFVPGSSSTVGSLPRCPGLHSRPLGPHRKAALGAPGPGSSHPPSIHRTPRRIGLVVVLGSNSCLPDRRVQPPPAARVNGRRKRSDRHPQQPRTGDSGLPGDGERPGASASARRNAGMAHAHGLVTSRKGWTVGDCRRSP
jgi:hypothetical protein